MTALRDRTASPAVKSVEIDGQPDVAHEVSERTLGALRGYFEVYEISADWRQVHAAPLAGLVTSLAMICPFEPCEKQARTSWWTA